MTLSHHSVITWSMDAAGVRGQGKICSGNQLNMLEDLYRDRHLREPENAATDTELSRHLTANSVPTVPIYGSVLSPKLMMMSDEDFEAYCKLRVKNRNAQGFHLIANNEEKEPCDLNLMRLVSDTIRSLSDVRALDGFQCHSSAKFIRLLLETLYSGVMPDQKQFEEPEFCRLVFELQVTFLMRLCNSTGVLDKDTEEDDFAEESSSEDSATSSSPDESSSSDEVVAEQSSFPPYYTINGFKYVLGRTFDNKGYYYCQWRRKGPNRVGKSKDYCRASIVFNSAMKGRFLHAQHAATCTQCTPTRLLDELSVRRHIEEMIAESMTATQIHQELLKMQENGNVRIPETINRQYIERLVQRMNRRMEANKSMFTEQQAKIDGSVFLQLESRKPFILIFATRMSITAAETSHEIFVGKLQGVGPEQKRVAVFFYHTVDSQGQIRQFKVMAYVVFDGSLEDRDGALLQATIRYLGWTGRNIKVLTVDLDANEHTVPRCLASSGLVGTLRTRTTQSSYEQTVKRILQKAKNMPEYNQLKVLKKFPRMEAKEIDKTLHELDQIRTDGKRAYQMWKKQFTNRISQISKEHIASDKGRNAISKWLRTVKIAESWSGLVDQIKSFHKTLVFEDDDRNEEEEQED